ncbi:MAG: hypothetical protein VZQ46_05735, partial [Megasphaera elsdenii]|nr:hypothetical protein [Megasphaera elsdenii]
FGWDYLKHILTLGVVETHKQGRVTVWGDNSFLILLYGLLTIVVILALVYLWRLNIRQNRQGRLPEIFDAIGTYSYDLPKEHKNGEFDVVTHDDKGYIFYEAKFRQTPITDAMIETEIRQVRQTGMDCYRYGFFSRAGYEVTPRPDVILYTLDDLFESC